jgi:hypothetical protein
MLDQDLMRQMVGLTTKIPRADLEDPRLAHGENDNLRSERHWGDIFQTLRFQELCMKSDRPQLRRLSLLLSVLNVK